MKEVLIVMSTRNRASTLPRALDSILDQIYYNWKLVILDDRSTDNTSEIIKKYCLKDNRITTMYNSTGKHFGVVKQEIALASSSDILAMLDDDDIWDKEYLELMVMTLQQNPTASEVYCDCYLIPEKGKRTFHDTSKVKPFPDTLPSLSIFNLKIFKDMNGWDLDTFFINNTIIHAEADFYIRAKMQNNIIHLPLPLVWIYKSSTSMSASRELNVLGMKTLMVKWYRILEKDKKVWAQYNARLGVHMIEADIKGSSTFLKRAIQNNPLMIEAWGGLILSSINRNLFLWVYNLYRRVVGV